jgi:ribosomal 50S subunit-recycling heat shock protein
MKKYISIILLLSVNLFAEDSAPKDQQEKGLFGPHDVKITSPIEDKSVKVKVNDTIPIRVKQEGSIEIGNSNPIEVTHKGSLEVVTRDVVKIKSTVQKWFYNVVRKPSSTAIDDIQSMLNESGENGWELVSATAIEKPGHETIFIFKKPQ